MIKDQKATINPSHKTFKQLAKTPQSRSFAWASLTILTICFFLLAAIRPTLITVAKLSREIKEKKEADKKLDEKIRSLVAAQNIYAKYSDKIFLLEKALPQENEFPNLVQLLENTAQFSQVEISSLAFSRIIFSGNLSRNTKDVSTSRSIEFSLVVKGEYLNLMKFLLSLENSMRLINLESTLFSEAKGKIEEELPKLSLNISGRAFYENLK